MKKLTKEEFFDRVEAVVRAKEIFIPHLTKNISIAFELYQEVLAERERKLQLAEERQKYYSVLSEYKRPECPKCGTPLFLRLIGEPKGPKNVHGYRTCWICTDGPKDCVYEKYSGKTLREWMRELEKKPEERGE